MPSLSNFVNFHNAILPDVSGKKHVKTCNNIIMLVVCVVISETTDQPVIIMVMPRNGDRIIVLKQKWLELVLAGDKTMEVRCKRLRAGAAYFGWKGTIYASATLGEAVEICDIQQWDNMRSQHCVPGSVLPYKRTFGLPIHNIERLDKPLSYRHPKGAVGIVKYRCD